MCLFCAVVALCRRPSFQETLKNGDMTQEGKSDSGKLEKSILWKKVENRNFGDMKGSLVVLEAFS